MMMIKLEFSWEDKFVEDESRTAVDGIDLLRGRDCLI